jgi:hypothetical protein
MIDDQFPSGDRQLAASLLDTANISFHTARDEG